MIITKKINIKKPDNKQDTGKDKLLILREFLFLVVYSILYNKV